MEAMRANPWRMAGWSFGALLVLWPLVAMQFTTEVNWTGSDFLFAGVLVGGTGLLFELAVRFSRNAAYRAGVALALAGGFLLIWVNGAVGIIGSEHDGANLMYAGVLGVGLIGALIARFRAKGLSRTLFGMAVLMVGVAVIAITFQLGDGEPKWPYDVIAVSGFFVALFVASGWLFRRAARQP